MLTLRAIAAATILVLVAACGATSEQGPRDVQVLNAEAAEGAPAVVTMLVPPSCGPACARAEAWLATKRLPVQLLRADPERCRHAGWRRACELVVARGEPRIWLGHLPLTRPDDEALDERRKVFERWPPPTSMLRPVAPDAGITMYTAPWCKPCEVAKRWFADRGLRLGEKDVARNLLWKIELEELLCERFEVCEGLSLPVFVAGERVLRGFDVARMEVFLAGGQR